MAQRHEQTLSIRWFLTQLFIQPCSTPPFIENFLTLLQFFAFTMFISTSIFDPSDSTIPLNQIQEKSILLILGLLVVWFVTACPLVKAAYIPILSWLTFCEFNGMTVVCLILLSVAIAGDVGSKIEFSFQTENLHSGFSSWFIIMHYTVLIGLTIAKYHQIVFSTDQRNDLMVGLLGFGLMFGLTLFKFNAEVKSESFKELHLRFYFLSMAYYVVNLIDDFMEIEAFSVNLLAVGISQMLYQFVVWKFSSNFSVEQYLSKNLYLEVAYKILCYRYSKGCDSSLEKSIELFVSDDVTNSLIDTKGPHAQNSAGSVFNAKDESKLHQQKKFNPALQKISGLIKENDRSLKGALILAEIQYLLYDSCIGSKAILNVYKERLSFWNFVDRIYIYKMEQRHRKHTEIKMEKIISPGFAEFIQNDAFRSLLLKTCLEFIALWEYSKLEEVISKKLRNLAQKVVESEEKIQNSYSSLEVKCIRTNILYGKYLFLVRRDIKKSNQMLEDTYFYHQSLQDLGCDKKIYIKLSVEASEPMMILNIGSNVNKLLGYNRRMLIGAKQDVLLPDFLRADHEKMVSHFIKSQSKRLLLFNRSSIIRNSENNYEQMLSCLKLDFDCDGQLFMHGFIKITTDSKHDWSNFLFVQKENLEIVGSSNSVAEMIGKGQTLNQSAKDYFDRISSSNLDQPQRVAGDDSVHFYEPVQKIVTFEDKKTIFLFVQLSWESNSLNNDAEDQHNSKDTKKYKKINPQMENYQKFNVSLCVERLLQKRVIAEDFMNGGIKKMKAISLILSLILVAMVSIECSELQKFEWQHEYKIQIMTKVSNLVDHYMSLSKIAIDLSYLHLTYNQDYVFQDFNLDFKSNIMTLQRTNQFFKSYSITQYEYESLSSKLEYRTNYEFITEIIGCASMVDTLNSLYMKKDMIDAYNELFTETFVRAYDEYYVRISKEIDDHNDFVKIFQVILLMVITVFSVIVYVLTLKIDHIFREIEFQTISFIGSTGIQNQCIRSAELFIGQITTEKIQSLMSQATTNHMKSSAPATRPQQEIKLSELSARENTGRDLMSGMSARQEFAPTERNNTVSQGATPGGHSSIKVRDRHKGVLLIPLLALLSIIGLHSANDSINYLFYVIDDSHSTQNIINLMNKPLYFTRVVNAFMTENHDDHIQIHDDTFYEVLEMFEQNNNVNVEFQESTFSEFSEFERKLRKIRYEYLCTYAECPEEHFDYMNILYATTMQKLGTYMLDNPHPGALETDGMDIVLISEQIFREVMIDVINTYIRSYLQFSGRVLDVQNKFMASVVVLTCLTLIAYLVLGVVFLRAKVIRLSKICDIVKLQSYSASLQAIRASISHEGEPNKTNLSKRIKKKVPNQEDQPDLPSNAKGVNKNEAEPVSELGLNSAYGFGLVSGNR